MDYPHQFITASLLYDCNKACKHCYRTAIPSDQEFKLNKTEAMHFLNDASSIDTACVFTGGECTIWKDADMDFLDLLQRAVKQNGRASFLSNGFVFEHQDYSNEWIDRYMQDCGIPLQMWFTVDFFHGNYNFQEKRIPFLDNLLQARNQYASNRTITFAIICHWTKDDNKNVPIEIFETYAKEGVHYNIDDFMTWGRASKLDNLSCFVQVGSSDKSHLGPYKDILTYKMIQSEKIKNENELITLSNRELLRRLSVCGKSPNFFTSWGSRYYYCIPQMGYDWFVVSELGQLNLSAIEQFYANRPVIKDIQKLTIFGVLDKYREYISTSVLEDIESMKESIRFAGCSVCLRLCKHGILQKINQRLIDK